MLRIQETAVDDQLHGDLWGFVCRWLDTQQLHIVVRETGKDDDNPHFHVFGYLQDGKKMPALRTWLNRKHICGNEMYSLKKGIPAKVDSHLDYLCKGVTSKIEDQPDIIHRSPDFDDAVVAQRHETYHKVNAQLPKKKRKREENAAQAIAQLEREKRTKPDVPLTRRALVKLAMSWTYANRGTLNVFYLKTVINHVSYGIAKEFQSTDHRRHVEAMTESLVDNF